MPTLSSTTSMPASAQACASSSLIGRDAPVTSALPSQKIWKPSPVPGPSTVTLSSPPVSSSASSLTRTEIGSTVDEPVTKTVPPASSMAAPLSVGSDAVAVMVSAVSAGSVAGVVSAGSVAGLVGAGSDAVAVSTALSVAVSAAVSDESESPQAARPRAATMPRPARRRVGMFTLCAPFEVGEMSRARCVRIRQWCLVLSTVREPGERREGAKVNGS